MPKGVYQRRPVVMSGAATFGGGGKDDAPRADVAARLDERDRRYARAAACSDPNIEVLADPEPGRSALDRRK
jgi:hypothetical protein